MGAKGNAEHPTCVPFKCTQESTRVRIPQPHGSIFTGRRKRAAVRAEGDAKHPTHVPLERAQEVAVVYIPQPRGVVFTPGHKRPPVRTEGDAAYPCSSINETQFLQRLGIVQVDAQGTGNGQRFAVRRPDHFVDHALSPSGQLR